MKKKALLLTKFSYDFPNYGSKPWKLRNYLNDLLDLLPISYLAKLFSYSTLRSIPHLGIGIVASELQSEGFQVHIKDLMYPKAFLQANDYDLIGISFLDISFDYVMRKLSSLDLSKTILGGIGATALEDRIRERYPAAAIVRGESEGLMKYVVADLKSSCLKTVYQREKPVNFQELSVNDPWLSNQFSFRKVPLFSNAWFQTIEICRGCHNHCDFCLTGKSNNITYKPINILEKELAAIKKSRTLFIIDQNLCSYPDDYLLEVFKLINKTGKRWVGEGTIEDKIDNAQLMRIMAENCFMFLVGIENFYSNQKGVASKNRLRANFDHRVKELRNYGIPVIYSMLFGTDEQYFPDSFIQSAEKVNSLGITVLTHIVTPRAGTAFEAKLLREGRIVDFESAHRNHREVIHEPLNMSIPQLKAGFTKFHQQVFSSAQSMKRIARNYLKKGLGYSNGLTIMEIYGLLWKRKLTERYHQLVNDYFNNLVSNKYTGPIQR